MKKQRPVNLDLSTIKMHAAANASILHRISGVFFQIIILGTLSALIYHLLGGIRHLIMDLGYFEELPSGNTTAKIIIALWLILTVVVGVRLW